MAKSIVKPYLRLNTKMHLKNTNLHKHSRNSSWQRFGVQFLSISQVGLQDNFFHLGGHSLLATQLASRIRQKMNVDIPLRTIFESPQICSLAQKIDDLMIHIEKNPLKISQLKKIDKKIIPLTPNQFTLWYGNIPNILFYVKEDFSVKTMQKIKNFLNLLSNHFRILHYNTSKWLPIIYKKRMYNLSEFLFKRN